MASTEGLDPVSTKRMDGAITGLEAALDQLHAFAIGLDDVLGSVMRPEDIKAEASCVNPQEEAGAYVYRIRHATATASTVLDRLRGYTLRLDV